MAVGADGPARKCEDCVFYLEPTQNKDEDCVNDNPWFPNAVECEQFELYLGRKKGND